MFGSLQDKENDLLDKLELVKQKNWGKKLKVTILDLDAYISGLNVSGLEPAAHFLHYTFTHFPVEFDRNCEYMGHNLNWFANNQNWSGVKGEARCALKKYGEFLVKLKKLGVFENSLVVLKSDHGKPTSYMKGRPISATDNKPVTYYESNSIFSKRIENNPMWGYGRYEPLLAIKDYNHSSNSSFSTNDMPVLLDDLALTLCLAAEVGDRCANYSGFDLLDPELEIPDDSYVFINVASSRKSDFRFRSEKSVKVKRQPNIHKNLYEVLTEEHQ